MPDSTTGRDAKIVSFSEEFKNRSKETVIVVGDSLVQGIGSCLEKDSDLFTTRAFRGAKIEHLENQLKEMGEKPDSHVVVMVGTNNLKYDGSEEILGKYEKLMDTAKQLKYRKVSFVGILERRDVNSFQNNRRRGVNERLKNKCASKDIGFIEISNVEQYLAKDGLHLNYRGQDIAARKIFSSCKKYLN